MKYKIPFALIVGGIIVFPPITSRIISPSIFMSLGVSEIIAVALYISLTFFVIAAALAVIFVAGVKLSQMSRASVVELESINELQKPNVGKPAKGKSTYRKPKKFLMLNLKRRKGMEDGFQALLMTCRPVGIPVTGEVMAAEVGIKQNPVSSRVSCFQMV